MVQTKTDNNIKNVISNNKILLLISLLFLVGIVIALVFSNGNSDEAFILLDANYVINVNETDYSLIDRSDSLPKRFLNTKLRVLYDEKFLGSYKIDNLTKTTEDDDSLYFNDGKKSFSFELPNIAMTANVEYIKYNLEDFENSDLDALQNVVGMYWIKSIESLTFAKKVVIDLNNDGIKETLYFATLTNEIIEGTEDGNEISYKNPQFSVVYIKINDEIIVLEDSTVSNTSQTLTEFGLAYIVDVFNDGKYEVILSYSDYDLSSYMIYHYDMKGNYVLALATGM
jgi:hypothetical protein